MLLLLLFWDEHRSSSSSSSSVSEEAKVVVFFSSLSLIMFSLLDLFNINKLALKVRIFTPPRLVPIAVAPPLSS
ncbi:hypothetical protein PRUPE_7G021000 [Prunus persica]|uniref:Uncharacterized protein n=1 Tax=Prunus persica TaxID=3760 RepID=A0A251N5C5_PRUPE|nr:hypothetical protein PRUPE_7G021000 [Prunus persica]